MISIIQEDRENYSFLLKVTNYNHDQRCEISEAIMAEGDSAVHECGDYWIVIPNDDYTTWSKMSDLIHSLMDKYNDKCNDNVGLQLTKDEVIALSVYFIDKDNDIEGYDIDELVNRIKTFAAKYAL